MSTTATLKDHTGHTIVEHGPGWSGCRDCHAWVDTRAAEAAAVIQGSPALLAEARGWIADAYPIGEGAEDILTPAAVCRVLHRGYDGGTPEFVRNSAALLQPVYVQGQTVRLLDTHPGDGGWSTAYVESVHGSTYGVRVQGHSLYFVSAAKLQRVTA